MCAVNLVIRGCIQKFPDWPPGARTANGTAHCHQLQLYRYFVSQSSEFCRHNPLCCFLRSIYCCCSFRYDSVRKLLDTPSYVTICGQNLCSELHSVWAVLTKIYVAKFMFGGTVKQYMEQLFSSTNFSFTKNLWPYSRFYASSMREVRKMNS
jgi:hypothetical protein